MKTMLRTIMICAVVSFLAACGGGLNMCEQRTDYKAVKASGKIIVPAELDPLPDINQLEIPSSSTPPDVDTSCLERPPKFFEEEGTAE